MIELGTQNIDGRFHGKGCCWDTRGAVRRRLGLIHQHVKTFDPDVGNIIGAHYALIGRGHGRAGEGSRLVDQVGFSSHQPAVLRGAELDADLGARGGTRGLKDLGTGHGHLHWALGLARHGHGHRFDVD